MIIFKTFMLNIFPIIFIILAITSWLCFAYTFPYSKKLRIYLQKNKLKRWKELIKKSKRQDAPLLELAWKRIAYIKDDKDINDKNIKLYKQKIRLGMKWGLRIFYILLIYVGFVITLVILLDLLFGIKV